MQILLNNEPYELSTGATLEDLLTFLKLEIKNFAVELNREIIPKTRLKQVPLKERDEVLLVSFVGGG
ncbi:MAG: sulfur carrier protein ThiS [Planctomycetota bacterium]